MTRRIALTFMTLIVLQLVLAVVPLGLSMTQREQTSFRDTTEAANRTVAAAAEETLSDHRSPAAVRRLLEQAERAGDCAAVFDAAGRIVAATDCPGRTGGGDEDDQAADSWGDLAHQVIIHPETVSRERDDRLVVAEPVGDTAHPVGAAVLSRSAENMHDRIAAMWGWLALIGVGALVAGVLLSVALARWVGRPLRAVDAAALRLGEGALEVRAPGGRGPQEVRRLASTFNTMAARMEALIHGHRAVVADVSHQLRTPLTALRLRLDLLAAGADDATAAEFAGAQEEIARLSRLVDGLLAVSRAENAVPRPVPVRVDQVVDDRVVAWEPVARERRVSLTGRYDARLTAYLGAGDLEQVIDNLVANALDAVGEGSAVRVEGQATRARVLLRVVDDGPGMSAAAREAAFRRFGNPEASGSGLGLAIVHRLVTANGGTVRLEETAGGGLTVVLELPALPPQGPSRGLRAGS
ncbi:sensor histidine kinase [Streptomyces sp. NBC_00151]|uniref:sensor histidine kinase n=1 Tax=Streptomyces sp. NBC_00151 TaxID=2975669 RepID=UPI002DDA5E67|nr:ATP-binding protein [Streptomyces sp. NBC_00151]WRZ44234.1 ATP-binding protein [Streptomyces sp. NBC_00151]